MLEVELKSLVPDWEDAIAHAEAAGATLVYAGGLEDRRYDSAKFQLRDRDHVLRVRVYRAHDGVAKAVFDWKGPTRRENGFKIREELSAGVTDPDELVQILDRLGYVVTMSIDREIAQYDLGGAMVRFERYPRMDDLVEVEGTVETIEAAIAKLGLPREGFTSERLPAFVRRYEARTGVRAALSWPEVNGPIVYERDDA